MKETCHRVPNENMKIVTPDHALQETNERSSIQSIHRSNDQNPIVQSSNEAGKQASKPASKHIFLVIHVPRVLLRSWFIQCPMYILHICFPTWPRRISSYIVCDSCQLPGPMGRPPKGERITILQSSGMWIPQKKWEPMYRNQAQQFHDTHNTQHRLKWIQFEQHVHVIDQNSIQYNQTNQDII